MANAALHEILSTQVWNMLPTALHAYRSTLLDNISARRPFVPDEEKVRNYYLSSSSMFSEKIYVEQINDIGGLPDLKEREKVIAVVNIEGPILRNNGACSYGSLNHKEFMMDTSSMKGLVGYILMINSPGGSAYSLYDYEDAINDARSKGKSVVAFVKGMACSAGYAAAMMCDEVYAFGDHDVIGCIGSMLATYLNAPGDVNSITQEKYVEIYAEGSPYKNHEHRTAEKGDYSEWQKMVNDSCNDFHAAVSKYRPQVTDEQKKGETYFSGEVIGTMIDGIATMEDCINRVLAIHEERQMNQHKNGITYRDRDNNENQVTNKKEREMEKKQYVNIQQALNLSALEADPENGLYFVEAMADRMEEFAASAFRNKGTLDAKLSEIMQLNAKIAEMQQKHAEELASLNAAHTKEVEDLKAKQLQVLSESETTLKAEVDELKQKVNQAEDLLAKKDAEIQELSGNTQDPPKPEEGKGGTEVEQKGKKQLVSISTMEDLSIEEKQEMYQNRMKYLAGI